MRARTRTVLVSCCVVLAMASLLAASVPAQQGVDEGRWAQDFGGHLPRWREGGTPAEDPNQSLLPLTVDVASLTPGDVTGPPLLGLMASPPEYDPTDGVIFRYGAGWTAVVTDCVAQLTGDPTKDEIAYVVVTTASQISSATSNFVAAGADMSKVVFLTHPSDSIWLRDYGPHFVWQDGAMGIADSHYYPSRPRDNFIPSLIAEDLGVPPYHMGLYYSGGNFQPGPNRHGFTTSLVYQDNPGFTAEQIGALYSLYQGIDTLHIMPRLPGSVDGTGHIDMWMYLVDEDDVIISQFLPGSNPTAIDITDNAVPYMEALGFTVTRVPAWNVGSTHYTYTNAFRVNDRIFVPTYGEGNPDYLDDDAQALAAWQTAAGPGVEIVGINSYSIIPAAGAIHCIMMQVPRYTDPVPSASLVTPEPDALYVQGTVQDIHWTATDDVAIASVDLEYSVDGGATFPFVIATGEADDGHFDWTVPATYSPDMAVRLTAHDGSGNSVVAECDPSCEISDDSRTVYDFATGAGVDKWVWGNSTSSWSELSGTRYPAAVSTEIETLHPGAYLDIAFSDAVGGDNDPNRYVSAKPTSSRETTHIVEFDVGEAVWTIRDLALAWEGYGDDCIQMEMYVWDNKRGDWGDGAGLAGQNNYMANYAGNLDETLVGHVRDNFGRYVDLDGKVTFLLYGERSADMSFHDHVELTVTWDGGVSSPWTDLGNGLAGTYAAPTLAGQGTLVGGDLVGLDLTGALELAPATLVIGLADIAVPFKGGVMVPRPDILIGGLSTDANGDLALSSIWPDNSPSGFSVVFQYWIGDAGGPQGFSASNGLMGLTP